MKTIRNKVVTLAAALSFATGVYAQDSQVWLEAENFDQPGGWVVDQQFMDLMGSPYLMAHGLGRPVADAVTSVNFDQTGEYHVYVRTYNWTSPWHEGKGPGVFTLKVDGKPISGQLGNQGNAWMWQYVGKRKIQAGQHEVALADQTGFNGRCDAIYFSTNYQTPPSDLAALKTFRRRVLSVPEQPEVQKQFDLVVVGGGVAGMCAAMAAAREGMQVALINDRPILGGCNSSEIRVHLGGRIEVGPYQNLGNMIKEFGHVKKGNAQPAENYMDQAKLDFILSNKNITLFPSNRVLAVDMDGDQIEAVTSQHIETGEEIRFQAPLFADCTGDGTVGALAGADYRMGREGRAEHQEPSAPEVGDKMTMGSSVQWYSKDCGKKTKFPRFEYGVKFDEAKKQDVTMGEWTWETGAWKDQITEFENIRDYGLLVVLSNWSYLKNDADNKKDYANRDLDWVAYVAGKRESRRLLGDYILNENDLVNWDVKEDPTAATTWSIDLHYPDPENTKQFEGREFKSIAKHKLIYEYPVPYRCLYSRNVNNLFMAGRNISVTHVALGTVRVMRTTGMLGEVVGLAASVCHDKDVLPRQVYQLYMPTLNAKMQKGAGKPGLENNQLFNTGGHLKNKPVVKNL